MKLNLAPLHVLIVEDVQPLRELIREVLRAIGVGFITSAKDGEDAYEKYCTYEPDIIITDWHMPVCDGLELTKKIRCDAESPNRRIPIIMLTGFSSAEEISQARDCGITEFIAKPFTSSDIAKKISHIVNSPREFIIANDYVGPSRRRRDDDDEVTEQKRGKSYTSCQILEPNKDLQRKIGTGSLDEKNIVLGQKTLEIIRVNFLPMAQDLADQLNTAIIIAEQDEAKSQLSLDNFHFPITQLKVNGIIFKYDLISNLSAIIMKFIENLKELDDFAIQIIRAYHTTLTHIINQEMEGTGGENGNHLYEELGDACKRYYTIRKVVQNQKFKKQIQENA